MSKLKQSKPADAPAWAFWLETNSVFGWIINEDSWKLARAYYWDVPLEYFKQAAFFHPSMIGTGAAPEANFGLRHEHTGTRTLADHAREHQLTWLK